MKSQNKIKKLKIFSITIFSTFSFALSACNFFNISDTQWQANIQSHNNDNIVLSNSFSAGGTQVRALNDIVKKYNDTFVGIDDNGKLKDPDALEVKLDTIQGGYQGASKSLNTMLEARSPNLPNIILNYPHLVSSLALNKRELNLKDEELGLDNNFYNNIFEPAFLEGNKMIAGTNGKGYWQLPFSKSTEILVLNKPLLGYIIGKITNTYGLNDNVNWTSIENQIDDYPNTSFKPAQIEKNDAESKNYFKPFVDSWNATPKDKKGWIKSLWTYQPNNDNAKTFNNFILNKNIMDGWKQLLEFANKIKDNFTKHNAPGVNFTPAIYGIDSPANNFYAMAFSKAQANYENFLYTPRMNDDNEWNFTKVLSDFQSEQFKLLKDIYQTIDPALKKRSIMLLGGGSYSSNYAEYHQFPFSVSSSVGLKHYYANANESKILYDQNLLETMGTNNKIANLTNNNLLTLTNPPTKNTTISQESITKDNFLASFKVGRYNNFILKSTYNLPIDKEAIIQHNFQLKTTDGDAKLEKIINEKNGKKYKFYATFGNHEIDASLYEDVIQARKYFPRDKKFEDWKIIILDEAKIKQINSSYKKLTKNDTHAQNAPFYYDANKTTETKKVITSQGPALMAIKTTEKRDKATKKFIKWLISEKVDWSKTNNNQKGITGLQYFAQLSGYIAPLKTIFQFSESDFQTKVTRDEGTIIAFNNFKNFVQKDNEYAIYEDPSDLKADQFRNWMANSLIKAYNTPTNRQNFDSFLKSLISLNLELIK